MRMTTYIVRRLLLLIPVLLGVSVFVFSLTRLAGNPAAAYINDKMTETQIQQVMARYHFNAPVWDQYFYWLSGLIQGDWGYSKVANMPVTQAIITYFPATFELTFISIVIAVIIGIYLGTLSAVRKDKPVDHATRIIALSGVSLPIFWLGLLLQLVFYRSLHLLPATNRISDKFIIGGYPHGTGFLLFDSLTAGNFPIFFDEISHIILPAVTLAFGTIAIIARIMRSSMLEVMNQDYVKTARAKGLPNKVVIKKHARRNALIPTTTVVGLSFGGLLSGAVLTESIFSWPGLGQWSANAILRNDTASVLGFVLLIAIIYVLANLIVDLMYAYLDPRVRLE
jgi:ABC-type dipeptide/oligopeptide/nickel transport system permease component